MKAKLMAVAGLLCALGAPGARAQELQMTLAGASPGGIWALIGVGIDRAAKAANPKSTITYQTSGGGFANIMQVDTGKVEIALAHNAELRRAVLGTEPFKQPMQSMRAIANIYNWAPMHAIVVKSFAEKHGLKTFEDLVTKKPPMRLTVNRRGNITEGVAEAMLRAAGATLADLEKAGSKVIYAGSEEQADLIKDGRIDVYINGIFAPQSSMIEVGKTVPIVMLPVSKAVIDKVVAEEGIIPFVIPAKTYEFQDIDIPTVALGAMVFANSKMNDDTAYALAKVITENLGELKAAHKNLNPLTAEFLVAQDVIPFHPGAIKYYKEKGMMK
jgi:TRAP transporter TAXI family solute receptor